MEPLNLSNEILDKIENDCQNDYIGKEQYYDYLTDCQFRSSIITHTDNIKNIVNYFKESFPDCGKNDFFRENKA